MTPRPTPIPPLRFAAPAYANAAPLAQFIPTLYPETTVILDHPSRLLGLVLGRQVDAACMPVADIFSAPSLKIIEGVGICAEKRVRSVVLRCHRQISELRSVRPDPASRTSNALAYALLRHYWKTEVRFIAPDGAEQADAEVVIGDRALCEPAGRAGDLDLATAWNALTGLPFVFAAWAYRADHPQPDLLTTIVRRGKEAGVKALAKVAREQAATLNLPEALCQDYFAHCVTYDRDARHEEALQRFKAMIAEQAQDWRSYLPPPATPRT